MWRSKIALLSQEGSVIAFFAMTRGVVPKPDVSSRAALTQEGISFPLIQHLLIRIGAADQFQVQSVRIFHKNVSSGLVPLDECLVFRQDAAAAGFDLRENIADMADPKRHAAGHRVRGAEVERLSLYA